MPIQSWQMFHPSGVRGVTLALAWPNYHCF